MAKARRRYEAEAMIRGDRVAVFPWFRNAAEPTGEPFIFGTDPSLAESPDPAWIGSSLLAALEMAKNTAIPPADPIKPFNKARTKTFGVTSLKALRQGLVTVSVRVDADLVHITPFAGDGTPGDSIELSLPVTDEELGNAVLAAASSMR